MTTTVRLDHTFVDSLPERLDEKTLYICIPYATVAHRCLCGCGNEVVTPLGRADWNLTYDGETVSLSPSIGSWSLPCRSHYVVTRSRARWARPWTPEEIETGRTRDHDDRNQSICDPSTQRLDVEPPLASATNDTSSPSLWRRIVAKLTHRETSDQNDERRSNHG